MSTSSFRHRTLRERLFSRDHRSAMGMGLFIIPVVVLVFAGIIFAFFASYTNSQTQTCTVSEKDRTRNTEGASDMRIYTEECGVLSVKDMFFAGEWNSADSYNAIEIGITYEFKTTGYRVGFLSMFPIIRESQEVKSETPTSGETTTEIAVGSILDTVDQVEATTVGTLLRAGSVTFERVETGFQIVGTADVKASAYVASFAPLNVVYLP